VSFIKSRLRRIELASRRSYRCPECGLPLDGPGRIVLDRIPEGEPEQCPQCRRWLWFVIEVVYDSPTPRGEGATVGREMFEGGSGKL
jgi:DNA-directed RNA polymerase subunit RPC12/RpoP